jgi:hypothetical protein
MAHCTGADSITPVCYGICHLGILQISFLCVMGDWLLVDTECFSCTGQAFAGALMHERFAIGRNKGRIAQVGYHPCQPQSLDCWVLAIARGVSWLGRPVQGHSCTSALTQAATSGASHRFRWYNARPLWTV